MWLCYYLRNSGIVFKLSVHGQLNFWTVKSLGRRYSMAKKWRRLTPLRANGVLRSYTSLQLHILPTFYGTFTSLCLLPTYLLTILFTSFLRRIPQKILASHPICSMSSVSLPTSLPSAGWEIVHRRTRLPGGRHVRDVDFRVRSGKRGFRTPQGPFTDTSDVCWGRWLVYVAGSYSLQS